MTPPSSPHASSIDESSGRILHAMGSSRWSDSVAMELHELKLQLCIHVVVQVLKRLSNSATLLLQFFLNPNFSTPALIRQYISSPSSSSREERKEKVGQSSCHGYAYTKLLEEEDDMAKVSLPLPLPFKATGTVCSVSICSEYALKVVKAVGITSIGVTGEGLRVRRHAEEGPDE